MHQVRSVNVLIFSSECIFWKMAPMAKAEDLLAAEIKGQRLSQVEQLEEGFP